MESWASSFPTSTAAASTGGNGNKGKSKGKGKLIDDRPDFEKRRKTFAGKIQGGQSQLLSYTASLCLQNSRQIRELFANAQRAALAKGKLAEALLFIASICDERSFDHQSDRVRWAKLVIFLSSNEEVPSHIRQVLSAHKDAISSEQELTGLVHRCLVQPCYEDRKQLKSVVNVNPEIEHVAKAVFQALTSLGAEVRFNPAPRTFLERQVGDALRSMQA
eukprot:TRINITY_DN48841_c0_g1_i1.p1 TRINITY_DN48841_c0_g1~~TRINITY_DN48841_c0_g1_i1.p1  ORF type:complete len:219 (-),score=32.85 TRINITY_DN48841_c0_g1_i1:137-793(-)